MRPPIHLQAKPFQPVFPAPAGKTKGRMPGASPTHNYQHTTLPIQPKLSINTPGDRYEQEADAMAEKVVQGHVSEWTSVSATPDNSIQRKCAHCEEEEEKQKEKKPAIQRKAAGSGGFDAPPSLATSLNTRQGSGFSLPGQVRAPMENAFSADFSGVRIHADAQAADMSSSIQARAFTHGHDIYFNQGAFAPHTQEGKKLLAHELTHVVQQTGAHSYSQIQRAPEPETSGAPAESEPEEVCVTFIVSTNEEASGGLGSCDTLKEGMNIEIDQPRVRIYEGDVFYIQIEQLASPPKKWNLPPDLELVQQPDDNTIQVRANSVLSASEAQRALTLTIDNDSVVPSIPVTFSVHKQPANPDAVNPELEQTEKSLTNLKAERKNSRHTLRQERRQARKEFRALGRDEKRQQRGAFRKKKRELRSKRRNNRKDFRKRKQALVEKRNTLTKENYCGLDNERVISQAMVRAVQVVNKTLPRLKAGTSDKGVSSILSFILKWAPNPNNPTVNQALIQKVVDVLSVARNNMMHANHDAFQCGSLECDENTGAFVHRGSSRGDEVTVCTKWLRGGLNFGIPGDASEQKAFALLHEFVHLAGPQGENETYVHQESSWKSLKYEQAIQMADAYARIAWFLGK